MSYIDSYVNDPILLGLFQDKTVIGANVLSDYFEDNGDTLNSLRWKTMALLREWFNTCLSFNYKYREIGYRGYTIFLDLYDLHYLDLVRMGTTYNKFNKEHKLFHEVIYLRDHLFWRVACTIDE